MLIEYVRALQRSTASSWPTAGTADPHRVAVIEGGTIARSDILEGLIHEYEWAADCT